MYRLTAVTKRYGPADDTVEGLSDVTLSVPRGGQLVVQGPPGGGKSTLLRLLGGLDRPTEGTVELDGTDLAALDDGTLAAVRAEHIGFVPRRAHLLPALTARQNVEAALVPLGVRRGERRTRAARALEWAGLGARLRCVPAELTPAERQRVAVARAVVKRPKVLLADEPTGGLGRQDAAEVLALLEAARHADAVPEPGYVPTLVMVTHDSATARRAPRLAVLRRGRVELTEREGGDASS
ncbi:ATP-binding cassette domain-containing protein [Streptomyces sp. PTM05]|uniref:ATP-binding cassette domain-containing protein n=1 Tax=Streptantibioticus parmotrematis TaxID=2873249 RepID=A0ABS7QLD5_9ACTN|nr:ATP-binding cassette domain-containing protein [Streptantibioticus parmotrematis]MBY8883993.1 ATP-binding cassette domain-containing protein [Streptantibioticus parmotrematis]